MAVINYSLLNEFNYHDGKIVKFQKEEDILIKFVDGWNSLQVNEILLINAKTKYNLSDIEIYQFENLEILDDSRFQLTLSIWKVDRPVELKFIADNIISRMYDDGNLVKEENLLDLVNASL